jgi:hypothetical protein
MSNKESDFELFDEEVLTDTPRVAKNIKMLPLTTIEGRRQRYMLTKPFLFTTIPVFTTTECEEILSMLTCTTTSRHSSFKTQDFSIHNHPKSQWILQRIELILRHLEEQTGFLNGDLELLDCFFVCYNDQQPNLEPHTDGCLLSFNVLLNSPHEFTGGGTRFVNLNQTKKISQGEALLHSAKLLHEGVRIEEGRRIILVGFVESKRTGPYSKKALFEQDLSRRNLL